MANLEHLKIKNAPAAFADFAERHNELVGLIASLEGSLGIDIQIAHSPKAKVKMPPGVVSPKARPRGKILVSVVPTALDGSVSGGGGSSNANVGGTTQAVGVDGKLYDVLQPHGAGNATNYPTALGTRGTGTQAIDISGGTVIASNGAKSAFISAIDGFGIANGTYGVSFAMADITHDIRIKTMAVCVNNVSMNVLVLASDPF